jgi:hypothetical protein
MGFLRFTFVPVQPLTRQSDLTCHGDREEGIGKEGIGKESNCKEGSDEEEQQRTRLLAGVQTRSRHGRRD